MKAALFLPLSLIAAGCTAMGGTGQQRSQAAAAAEASPDAEAHCSQFGRVARLGKVSKRRVVYDCVPRT
jgi:hypothetical protein